MSDDDKAWMQPPPAHGRTCSRASGCKHTIHCRSCDQTWTEGADLAPSGCGCTCSDPDGEHYEDWVIDPPGCYDNRVIHDDDAGEAAYLAYGDYVDWVNIRGERMPNWEELPAKIQNAWRVAIQRAWPVAARAAIAPSLPPQSRTDSRLS